MFNRHQQLDPNFNVQNLTVYWSSIGIDANATVRFPMLHYMSYQRVWLIASAGHAMLQMLCILSLMLVTEVWHSA